MRTSIIILPAILAPLAEAFAPVSAITVGRCHSETSASVLGMAKDEESNVMNRRNMFSFVAVATASSILGVERATALDMDAFMNSQLQSDQANCNPKLDRKCIPKLSQDEALCKYGQTGNARGEACQRVKESGKEVPKANAGGKSLGGAYAM